jgi:Trk K+ transport system NAD-binding subunit
MAGGSRRFVVCGGNALARRLVGELVERHRAQVTVVVRGGAGAAAELSAGFAGPQPDSGEPVPPPVVLAVPQLTAEVYRQAGLVDAAAVALVDQDDIGNLDAALIAREVNPGVRIVARLFNQALGEGLPRMIGDCTVLSASEIAAPAFVAAVLGADTPTYLRLPDQLLRVAQLAEVSDPDDIVCGLAITGTGADPELLPADDGAAGLVLARAYGNPPLQPRRRRHPLRATRLLFGRNLRIILGVLLLALAVGTAARVAAGHLGLWQALYLTILSALGGANPDLEAAGIEQAADIMLVVVGVALVPALTAAVVEVVVRARLALALGGLAEPVADHVIVVGMGSIGARMVRELHELGLDVVAVDRSEDARGVEVARELGIPVVIGDATRPETLRAASVATCRTLATVGTDDLTNLETAVLARSIHQDAQRPADGSPGEAEPAGSLRVVLRLFDADLAARVTSAFDLTISRSVSYLAAPAFAAAMVGREVIDTIPVGRHVLLLAELPVGAGSPLEGQPCAEVNQPHATRLVAVRTGRGPQTLWRAPPRRPLVRTDRLLIVATRSGLADLVPRTIGVPNPPPLIDLGPPRLLTVHSRGRRPAAEPTKPTGDPAPTGNPEPASEPDPTVGG